MWLFHMMEIKGKVTLKCKYNASQCNVIIIMLDELK